MGKYDEYGLCLRPFRGCNYERRLHGGMLLEHKLHILQLDATHLAD
jgi:hypothetical protein